MAAAALPRIHEALQQARAAGLAAQEAQWLLAALLQRDRAWLISHDDAALEPAQAERWAEWLQQRLAGVPLAYLVGEKEFHGLLLQVTPDTLVPRPDTEILVDWALELLPEGVPTRTIDLGTGSGAIALALKHRRPAAEVHALDLSAGALAVAQANASRHKLDVHFHQGSWWQPLAGERFGLIVSNPPYIAGDDPHLASLQHEPLGALTPGGDGLADLRTLIDGSPAHLLPGGWLLLEHGYDQAAAVTALLRERGFDAVGCRQDLAGLDRVSGGRWPG
ncbi:peptide chain release factor N(5)-glutamine methyltransferase [Paucibacter sp. APW11]|uniref:Release factor glutamine methyltransferase n=1 Tax=Roseateles aquae TaxID=3077235 RepID=A0ABU3PEX4_9BURK|nr:peptide chain release factor N(5)-glutamine methyltransferase [Paucibacter sp. APW11]MDT9001129.1 peptide chain release factor N(5)-glutamine methyltransferase [Paucibacter sp. APW11]